MRPAKGHALMARISGAFARRITAAAAAAATLVVPALTAAPAGAAGTVKSAVSLTGPAIGVYGNSVTLTGTAWRYGTSTKLVNATIWLQRHEYGKTGPWYNVAPTHTSSTGTFAFSFTLGKRYYYRAYYGGSSTYTANVSAVHYMAIQQKVVARYLKDTNWTLGSMEGKTSIYPLPPKGTKVWLQRLASTGQWYNYISGLASGISNDVVIRGNVGGSVGTYRFYVPVVGVYSQNNSSSLTFAHYKWRGAFKKSTVATGGSGDPHFTVYTDDATHTAADAYADPGGSVWADLNTVGCKRIRGYFANFADAPANVALIGAGVGIQVSAAQNEDTPGERTATSDTFSPRSTVRFQVADTTSTLGPDLYLESQVLCTN